MKQTPLIKFYYKDELYYYTFTYHPSIKGKGGFITIYRPRIKARWFQTKLEKIAESSTPISVELDQDQGAVTRLLKSLMDYWAKTQGKPICIDCSEDVERAMKI